MPRGWPTGELEAVVIGGGPAGSALGRLLALWGHSVLILTKPEAAGPTLGESIPPSCRKLLAQLGALEAVDEAGFARTRGHPVWWGNARRSESVPGNTTGYPVVRGEFDRLLLGLAETAGARVLRNSTVRRVDVAAPGEARIDYAQPDATSTTLTARFVLDCSGRAGVLARQGLRNPARRHATLALAGMWTREGNWELEDETHTLVETYQDGWGWSVPVSPSLRYVTLMVDPRVTDLAATKHLHALYRTELGKTRQLGKLVAGATSRSDPWACDASLYTSHQFAASNFLLVGDAASFIDPLSSFGVKKAMASAWVAAVVIHTCLTNGAMQQPALELFATREQEVYTSYLHHSARFFQEAASKHQHPFWTGRSSAPDIEPTAEAANLDMLRDDPDVRGAFGALKASAVIRLRAAGHLTRAKKPAIEGREVILEDRLVSPALPVGPAGIRFLRGVDLPRLVELADQHSQVPDLYEAYNRVCQPVILPDFLGALSVLLGKGMLTNEEPQAV